MKLDLLTTVALLGLIVILGLAALLKRTESVAGWLAVIAMWWALAATNALRGPWDAKLVFLLFSAVVFTGVKVAQLLRWALRRAPPRNGSAE